MNTIEFAYRRFCKERFPPPSEEGIAELEHRIGVTFPDDYRNYLLEYNGGYFTEPTIIPPSDGCPEDLLTYMHGIGALYPNAELATKADLALFDDNDPPQGIPIGYTIMGSLIMLMMRPEDRGCILYKQASGGFFFLADGIEDFFDLLQEPLD